MIAEASPFPAVDLQRCRSARGRLLYAGAGYTLSGEIRVAIRLPLRIPPPANRLDAMYAAKLQRGYELMPALPDTNGRTLRTVCAYCDSSFYFPVSKPSLEVHQSWLFLPWHRMFLYFHERILDHLLEDDAFAVPFWHWDDTSAELDSGNRLPDLKAA